jgi:hypothetical protein
MQELNAGLPSSKTKLSLGMHSFLWQHKTAEKEVGRWVGGELCAVLCMCLVLQTNAHHYKMVRRDRSDFIIYKENESKSVNCLE